MLSNLTDKKFSKQFNHRAGDYSYKDYINWGKACTTKEGVDIMQGSVTCKDYIVDTYFKSGITFHPDGWTEEERYECCFYISLPTEQYATNFEENINNFLNSYEKSHQLKKTIINRATGDHNLKGITFTIKGSQKWMSNALVMSMYLSLIRVCAVKQKMVWVDFSHATNDFNCNEMSYWHSLKPKQKELLLKYYAKVRTFMKPLPAEYDKTGYVKGETVGHGQCGFFYMFSMIESYAYNNSECYSRPFHLNVFGKQLWKDLNDGKEFTPQKPKERKDEW